MPSGGVFAGGDLRWEYIMMHACGAGSCDVWGCLMGVRAPVYPRLHSDFSSGIVANVHSRQVGRVFFVGSCFIVCYATFDSCARRARAGTDAIARAWQC